MAGVKWIKIATDIFDDEKILLIEALPDAYAIITVWFKLLCLAGKKNNGGVFLMNDKIPYTDKMLATIFRMNESTVKLALNAFEQFKMIEIVEGIITIPNWNKHQTLDAYERKKERDRLYQEERRAKQRALIEKSSDKSSERTSDVAVSDIDKEEDKDIDKERDIRGNRVDYQQIADMYNATCVSFPRLTRLSEKRKRAIKARLRKYSIDDIQRVFEIAEESDFLKGENNRNWSADFDWMMNDTNMAKILDGKYANRKSTASSKKAKDEWSEFLNE
ncbi:phage replisome organizer N-terminal domain-containing protein [Mediterraneibacter gnavus]|uniref:phage replisome organizer N-terminal domain-containing protein n=1 Tax=Mediterraneibacter gnavus TaxID=33038 RepID=UPI00374E48DB